MMHSRFRHHQIGYVRWRCRMVRRYARLPERPLAAPVRQGSTSTAWRYTTPVLAPMQPVVTVLQIGKFVVSHEGDPQLHGHPDIRY